MESTNNFDLKVYEGTDLFNPLTTENENTVAIDEQMFKNQNAGIQTATELVSGTVHAITRSVADASVFRFTAVSRFTAGDTFTVDDIQVSALTTSGEQIPDGAFVIGSEVIGVLKGTLLTLYISMTKANTAKDAEKLGGQLPEYYGSAVAVSQAQETATAAGTLSAQNAQAITEINGNLAKNLTPEFESLGNGATIIRYGKMRELLFEGTKAVSGSIGNVSAKDKPKKIVYNTAFGYVSSNSYTQSLVLNINESGSISASLFVPNTTVYSVPSNDTGITGSLTYFVE